MSLIEPQNRPDPDAEFDWIERRRQVRRAFSPTAPINHRDLFAGRTVQLLQVIEGVDEPGQHLILFGERGVGKTSLASVAATLVSRDAIAVKVNCQSGDDFGRIWMRVFSEITLTDTRPAIGFGHEAQQTVSSLAQSFTAPLSSDDVHRAIRNVTAHAPLVVFIDEFDTIRDRGTQRELADFIKALSDQVVRCTIVLVGVAENVEELIDEHASVERALVQIPMPRMSPDELSQIVMRGLGSVGMDIDDLALGRITILSQGLPHYTHLLAQEAASFACRDGGSTVEPEHVRDAISAAVERSQESIASMYYSATYSARENMYKQVLLACACAQSDERGYFAASAVKEPLSRIIGKPMEITNFATHLNAFSNDRGPVLRKAGKRKSFRYRFTNPLLQPYVLLKGLKEGTISSVDLDALA